MFVTKMFFLITLLATICLAVQTRIDAFYRDAEGELRVLKQTGTVTTEQSRLITNNIGHWSNNRFKAAVHKSGILVIWNKDPVNGHDAGVNVRNEMAGLLEHQ
ncbi:hypothetical protein K461DRAFT_308755 [Myriangium duriaei CBS 260.36]|uniref:Uncharacterized protein n=1 Tax=Myriangium duriaei CBS 260.36 TaxID=1168546 RepID=A0A9P4MID4_9PEZI|nr:hypothetical protein K461DRAFT_308755 [Myriangium duriaei CBS 260.36]